jgi:TolB-like protein/Tfp pilus assembly protein PilF
MKRCPECRRDYYDDSLLYCLDDGSALLDGPASMDEPATAILSSTDASSEAGTIQFLRTTDPTISQPGTSTPAISDPRSRRNSIIAGVVGIILVTALGLGSYWMYGSPSPKQIESIAVMPFVNENGNADVEYLSDGMTESLISSLSQLRNLSVKARSSVFRYKGKDAAPQTLGRELGVQAILNGRVVQRGDLLTLSLELIDTATENVIWSEQYNRRQADLVALQSEIARDVSGKLAAKLSGEQKEQIAKAYTQNPEAYRLYLQGRYYWNRRKPDQLAKAIEYFEQAVALDPNYALAYAGLADCYAVSSSPVKGAEQNEKLQAAASKAISLDGSLGQPHAALANMYWDRQDWKTAEQEYRTAIELAPDYASGHQWFAELLTRLARHDEAIAEIKKARELDPLSIIINSDMIYILAMARRYDEAIEQAKRTLELDSTWTTAHGHLSEIYQFKGAYAESLDEEEKALDETLDPADKEEPRQELAQLREALRRSGPTGLWQKRLEFELQHQAKHPGASASFTAEIYTYLGNKDEAFKWLSISVDRGGSDLMKVWPSLDPLRDDPRYTALLKRLNLAD